MKAASTDSLMETNSLDKSALALNAIQPERNKGEAKKGLGGGSKGEEEKGGKGRGSED